MKLLHTADWHVGRQLRGRSRIDEHEAVLAEIAAIARAEDVDVVLVVGDLFDTAAPTPEAERVVYRALLDLADTGAHVVVLAGNHDSERRLQAVAPVLERGAVTTRASFVRPDEGGVLRVASRDGRETALIACLPFLSQRYVVKAADLMAQDAADASLTYAARIRALVAALATRFEADTVNVVAAHLMVDGATVAGSERTAHTIFEYAVPATAFPASAHYVALGHLHRQQAIAGPCPIRYCGSPLALDFGEVGDTKGVLLISASPGRPAVVTPVPMSAGRQLRAVAGSVPELRLLAPTVEPDAYIKVTVREPFRVGLADEVRDLFPGAVDIVVERPEASSSDRGAPTRRLGQAPNELFASFLVEQGIDDDRLPRMFDALMDEAGVS